MARRLEWLTSRLRSRPRFPLVLFRLVTRVLILLACLTLGWSRTVVLFVLLVLLPIRIMVLWLGLRLMPRLPFRRLPLRRLFLHSRFPGMIRFVPGLRLLTRLYRCRGLWFLTLLIFVLTIIIRRLRVMLFPTRVLRRLMSGRMALCCVSLCLGVGLLLLRVGLLLPIVLRRLTLVTIRFRRVTSVSMVFPRVP